MITDDEYADDRTSHLLVLQKSLEKAYKIPLEVQVAHFTPSSFPLLPIINPKSSKLCAQSWKKITENVKDELGNELSGITVFYNEFYERLEQFDSSGRFDAVLSRHSSGSNRIAAKGAILIRIINFILKIEEDNKETQLLLFMLGKSHAQKHIRPWQYSIFVQTLLITIASRLGTFASNDVMEAWVNLFAFVLKSMLPQAIKDAVVLTELNINTSSEFDDKNVNKQVQEIEDEKDMRRKLGGVAFSVSSDHKADNVMSFKDPDQIRAASSSPSHISDSGMGPSIKNKIYPE
jgi:hemoglobin-like flavoprotein